MAPTLAYIILHTEPPLYQLFNRKNVGMRAKNVLFFSYIKNASSRPHKGDTPQWRSRSNFFRHRP